MLRRCASCGHENREGASFCISCGAPLSAVCANCGRPLLPGARFCDSCGTPADSARAHAPVEGQPIPTQPAETIEFLEKLPIFQHIGREALERLAQQMQVVPMQEGPVFKEKDEVLGLYIIKSGAAKVTKSAAGGGPEAVLAILSHGDSFGEIGLIDGLPASADVTAMQPMECYFLGRDVFLGALEEHPALAVGMLESLAGMVRNADEWVARAI